MMSVGKDLEQDPALELAQRATFLDKDLVADLGHLLLVVSIELGGLAHDFLKLQMGNAALHLDDDGLRHLVRDHDADAGLGNASRGARSGCGGGATFIILVFAHDSVFQWFGFSPWTWPLFWQGPCGRRVSWAPRFWRPSQASASRFRVVISRPRRRRKGSG